MDNRHHLSTANTADLLQEIRSTQGTWTKGWTHSEIRAMKPFNPISGHVYRGQNVMGLYLPQLERYRNEPGYSIDLRYATEKQIKDHSGYLIPGAIGYDLVMTVVTPNYRCRKQTKVYPLNEVIWESDKYRKKMSDYRLRPYRPENTENDSECIKILNRILEGNEIKTVCCRDMQPSYVPHENTVYFPRPEDFVSDKRRCEAVFHEIAHWTRHNIPECRRVLSYPSEELTAELASILIMQHYKIEISEDQWACIMDYLRSWLRPVDDSDCCAMLEEAMGHAERAAESLTARIASA
jgi:antirestriction protein ArdC